MLEGIKPNSALAVSVVINWQTEFCVQRLDATLKLVKPGRDLLIIMPCIFFTS